MLASHWHGGRSLSRKSSILFIVLALQGCAGAILAAGVGGIVVNETTGKSVTDHVVSTVNNKDCRVFRALKDQEICQTSPVITVTTNANYKESSNKEIESRYR